MRVLVAGCGDLGARVGVLLSADGWEVWGLRRSTRTLPTAIQPLALDLTDPLALASVPDVELIVFTAAAPLRNELSYQQTYVDAVANLLEVYHSRSIRPWWLHVSSTSVYGEDDGSWVDEQTPARPEGFAGRLILEGERLLERSGWATTVLRLGGIYGPASPDGGRTWLLDSVRSGRAFCEDPPVWTNRIHVDDAARALQHLARRGPPEHPFEVLIGVDDEPAEDGVVKRWLAQQLGLPAPPTSNTGSRRTRGNKRCSNRRLRATGFELHYPSFRSGYEMLVRKER